LKNGGVLVALQFDSDTNEEKVKPYNTMLNKMYEGEITLHELYLHFSESSANEESVKKLKLAQVKVEQQKKMGAIPISTEKAEYMRDQSIAYINEKYGNQIDKNNNTSEQLRCDSVPEADLFASQYCNDHSPVHLDMPAEARLTHCLSRSWPGYSLDPSNYVT